MQYRPEVGVLEIGAHLLPQYWRQGCATEATRCVIDHAFRTLKLREAPSAQRPLALRSAGAGVPAHARRIFAPDRLGASRLLLKARETVE